ncbi:MAG: helix-turn-helix transcriptional regulator, partial [Anaerolineales bacterium]|nr:helix-turn-helix transcriptional regulator [Anaerolineales bacterium]
MDALQRINQALAYIEANLEEEIDYRQIETIALCSEYHFRRLFSFLAGVSLGEYVRRRRLTLAAFALQ